MWRSLFTWFMGIVDPPLFATLNAILGRASVYIGGMIVSVMAIAIVFSAVAIAIGASNAPAAKTVTLFVQIAIVSLFTSLAAYNYWVRDLILVAAPNDLGRLAGVSTANTTHSWDVIWNMAQDAGWGVWNKSYYTDPRKYLVILYFVAALAAVIYGFGVWLKAHVMSFIYLALGFVLVPMILFKTTRPIFSAWLGSTLSCVVLKGLAIILTVIVFSVESILLGNIINDTTTDVQMQTGMLFGAIVMFGFFIWIARDLPNMAAAITGGVHYSPQALGAATYGAVAAGAVAGAGLANRALGYSVNQARSTVRRSAMPVPATAPGPSISRGTP